MEAHVSIEFFELCFLPFYDYRVLSLILFFLVTFITMEKSFYYF